MKLSLTINGARCEVEIMGHETLLDLLRDHFGLTGTKRLCEAGECGACTILLDGRAVYACLLLAGMCRERQLVTVEGLADAGELRALQAAYLRRGALGCGFCAPSRLLTLAGLLERSPSDAEALQALTGAGCRCHLGAGEALAALRETIAARGERST